ncbi:putative spermidine/putrescine transport system substrate-binding protein [Kaistia soli DSM 19436]|uniref:Putative spermidine/putrescine transport system substrate-binding protein n=1 Tax=Kaistia soli DSM 19436 TaxID=1122133 RepID=A0A1M5PGV3_9HYPH|nr:extracellular solute-binding protein [Kaistia soli]SHH00483.1 putative spermidine/putrescine transport system substrate-binding protein [Kaistia soli DSM 19436]
MPDFKMNRRQFGLGLAAAGLSMPMLSRPGLAAGSVTVATFPNAWEQAYRKVIVPMLAAKGTTLTIAPALTTAQIAKVLAAKQGSAPPPYDALLLSPGDIDIAVKNDLLAEVDPSKISNWSKLAPASQGKYGPTVTLEVDGFAYNPDVVPKPTSYKDLFENPAFAGKVSWTGFDSNTAIEFYSEIAKVYGSGPYDMDAVFKLFKDKKDFLGPIVDTTSHQMTMLQQGEIGVFMASTNNVAQLKALGAKAEFTSPDTGSPAVPVVIVMTKGATNPDAVHEYMDAAISADAQNVLQMPPTEYIPTNSDVKLAPGLAAYLTPETMSKLVYLDWGTVAQHRAEWTKQFDRVVKG